MSKTISYQDTLVVNPSGINTSQSSYSTASNNANAYTNTSSTTYSSLTCNTGSGASSYVTYTFDLSAIPEGATIDSVTCSAKARVSSTSYISTATLQLYSNTTAKGSTTSFRSTSETTYNLSVGTWTRGELLNARIRATATRGTQNTTRAAYIYFYGANLTVNYSVDGIGYTITGTSSVDDVTITPSTQDVFEGKSGKLTIEGIDDINDVTITDNGVDISSNLVEKEYATNGTLNSNLGAYTLVSGSFNGSGATHFQGIVGNGSNASTTSSNYYSGGSGTIAVFTYNMPITNIPSNATITRVYCQVSGHAESTSNDNEYMCVKLISGSTDISSELNFKSIGTSNSVQTLEATTIPTISQLAELKLQCRLGYYGGAINGATVYVVYTTPSIGSYYEYTISNIDDDHVVLVELAGTFVPPDEDPEYNYYPITISSINAKTNPGTGTTRVIEGSNQTVNIYPTESQVTLILDNGVDVSSQLVSNSGTQPSYTVTTAPGASYGFNLNNSTGYYVSSNAGVSNSAAVARVNLSLPVKCLVTFTYINYSEATYDFGVFGKVDTTLSTAGWTSTQSAGDSTTDAGLEKLRLNTTAYNTSSAQTLTYEIESGEHYIDVKYGKNAATDSNNDTLQFKLEITALEPTNYYTYTLDNINQKHSLIFVFGDVSYYYVTSSGTSCKLYPDGQFVKLEGDSYRLTIVPDDPNATVTITDNNADVTGSLELKTSEVEKDGSTVTYKSYNYSISNISAAHTLLISCATNGTYYMKVNGAWVAFSKVYKKIDDRWQEQSDFSNIFGTNTIYIST